MKKWLFIFLLLPCVAWAESTTVFSGTSGLEDVWLDNTKATTNHGAGDSLWAYKNTIVPYYYMSLIRPLGINDTIPDSAYCTACTLTITVLSKTPTPPPVTIYKLCRPWIENEATFMIWKTSYDWTTAGAQDQDTPCDNNEADGTGADISMSSIGGFTGTVATHKVAIDTATVTDWIQGSTAVNGFRLYVATNATGCYMASTESGSDEPELKVVWGVDSTTWFDARHGGGQVGQRHGGNKSSVRHGRP